MKIMVFGSTGGIGHHVVEQALEAGHQVSALARRPEAITIEHPHLQIVKGDVLQPATFNGAMAGQDAVISALGVHGLGPTTVYSEGIANIIAAMHAARVSRLLCVSASGLDATIWWQRLAADLVLWRVLKNMYTDLTHMEEAVRASNLDWTIFRPPRYTDGPRTGRYQTAINAPLKTGWQISRADIADSMLHQVNNPASYCGIVEIAY